MHAPATSEAATFMLSYLSSLIMSDIFRVPLQRDDEESKVKEESVEDSKTVKVFIILSA